VPREQAVARTGSPRRRLDSQRMPARGQVWLKPDHGTAGGRAEPTRATKGKQTPRRHPEGPAESSTPEYTGVGPLTAPYRRTSSDGACPVTKLAPPNQSRAGTRCERVGVRDDKKVQDAPQYETAQRPGPRAPVRPSSCRSLHRAQRAGKSRLTGTCVHTRLYGTAQPTATGGATETP
jgi:hypothetical protein